MSLQAEKAECVTKGTTETNGAVGSDHDPQYDPTFTKMVIESMGPNATPRFREIMTSLIKHTHDFAREVNLTVDEWMQGVDFMNEAGKMTTARRDEVQLVSDVFGLSSLVDEITTKQTAAEGYEATASALLGPFFRKDAPMKENETSIIQDDPDGEVVYMHGHVRDAITGNPVEDCFIDIWQASTNGLYEQQDANQHDCNLRGKFKTDKDGYYALYCLRPTPYPIPDDGTIGHLMKSLDRHPWRPAHIHILAGKDGYRALTTQIFDRKSDYLTNDTVFAVKDSLVVDLAPLEGNVEATLEIVYDISLVPM